MSIVHQGNPPATAALAPAQPSACDSASKPSAVDIERMLRADCARSEYFDTVAAGLAAAGHEVSR